MQQRLAQQRVVPIPAPVRADRGDERVAAFELFQVLLAVVAVGQQVGETTADPVGHAGAQQKFTHLRRLAGKDLGQQIFGDRAIVTGELRGGRAVPGQEHRGQPQTGGPALGAFDQAIDIGCRQRTTVQPEKLVGLMMVESQVPSADLVQPAVHP